MKKYSKTTRGFYDTAINTAIPEDAVAILDADYAALISAQSSGMRIIPDEYGYPTTTGHAISVVPIYVTQRQAKLALLQAGLLGAVDSAISAITDPVAKRVAQIEWEFAQEVRRDWPLLVQMAHGMGMTDEQIDELFIIAAAL